ncbi:alpha/beta hydrolase fold domain-containing protein [Roseivirga pacifica]|uniref:alpha/beta hydrolase fold domain-containing protein n=1 Tax=Roseivirga pacifica TaxID=1267423 RepID=UPI003BB19352
MKRFLLSALVMLIYQAAIAQPTAERIRERLPEGTTVHGNIPYNNDTLKQHMLDIYVPANPKENMPLVVFVHGGGWIGNNKYNGISYMSNTVASILNEGMVIASIDYRYAFDAVFPIILQDCNKAVSFLYDNAEKYNLDTDNFALIGFSAGGHLASLMGTSQNNKVKDLYFDGSFRPFEYKAVVDFYGPTDLTLLPGNEDPESPEGTLIGAAPLLRPDLAKAASPIAYLDKNDPPFLIYHGEKDNIVSNKQSKLFHAWLNYYEIENAMTIVKGAPHFGPMYDVDEIRTEVMAFLSKHLK